MFPVSNPCYACFVKELELKKNIILKTENRNFGGNLIYFLPEPFQVFWDYSRDGAGPKLSSKILAELEQART